MNIAGVSMMNINSSGQMNQVEMAVMGMQLDSMQSQGATLASALDQLPAPALEQSVNPHIGGNLDLYV